VARQLISFLDSFESPFYHEILYTATDKAVIDHATLTARRVLTPHTMVIQMLFSRFQALRYQKPVLVNVLRRIIIKSARAFKFMRSEYDHSQQTLVLTPVL